jgi:hypothetical protein
MALYSMIGFGGGFVGPLLYGVVLDAIGSDSVTAWGCGFATLGLACAMGPAALLIDRLASRRSRPPGPPPVA